MEILREENTEYSFRGSYYPKVPSLVDGTFNRRYSFFRDTETSRLCDKLVDHYSEEQRKFAWRRNGSSAPKIEKDGVIIDGDPNGQVMAFRIARAWTYISIITGTNDFRGLKWCDMSAGWGVHLLTALLTGMEYFSCDPNTRMSPVYKRMISDYDAQDRAIVLESGFENVEVKENYYDIFFSSPPYFDWEVYSDDEDQSVKKFPNFILWCARFLIPCVKSGIKSLKQGGSMILHMEDLRTIRYCEIVVMYIMDEYPEMHFEGVISCGGKTILRPSFIWKKVTIPREKSNYLEHYYEGVYDNIVNDLIVAVEGNTIIEVALYEKVQFKGDGNLIHIMDRSVYRGMYVHFFQCNCETMIYFGSDKFELQAFLDWCERKRRTPIVYFITYDKRDVKNMEKKGYNVLRIFDYKGNVLRKEKIEEFRRSVIQPEDSYVLDFVKDITYIQCMTYSLYKYLTTVPPIHCIWITTNHLDVLQALCDATSRANDEYEGKIITKFMLLKTKFSPSYYPNMFKTSDNERITYIEDLGDLSPIEYAKRAVQDKIYVKKTVNIFGNVDTETIPRDRFWEVVTYESKEDTPPMGRR